MQPSSPPFQYVDLFGQSHHNLSCSAPVWLLLIGCGPAGQMEANWWNKMLQADL